ncbi:MAG: ATP-binding protein [Chamaesiphon sp.]|nr:ATP-binding protein [Chamaesiphon sp.]
MKLANALDIFDRLLVEKQGRKLKPLEREILAMVWENGPYREIAGYQEQTVKNHAVRLWKYLSQLLNTKVNKSNIRQVVENLEFELLEPMTAIESGNRGRFFGRLTELCQLQSLILPRQDTATKASQAKITFLYGMRGMGKTSLAQKLAENLSSKFDRVMWTDLAAAPPLLAFLSIVVKELDGGRRAKLSQKCVTAIAKTIGYLQQQRCLLILDNADPIFNSIDLAPAYIQFLDKLNTAEHQSFCLIITSVELTQIDGSYHKLELQGLDRISCQRFIENSELVGTPTEWDQLIHKYRGNPQYLKFASSTIRDIFNRSISKFLAENIIVYDQIEFFLAQQLDLLTHSELAVMLWLAIKREPLTLDQLRSKFDHSVVDRELVRILDRLVRQYLIEVKDDSFTLSELVMEYITEHYQDLIAEEIWAKKPDYLHLYPILLSHALNNINNLLQALKT